jgi:hypothetical protein
MMHAVWQLPLAVAGLVLLLLQLLGVGAAEAGAAAANRTLVAQPLQAACCVLCQRYTTKRYEGSQSAQLAQLTGWWRPAEGARRAPK